MQQGQCPVEVPFIEGQIDVTPANTKCMKLRSVMVRIIMGIKQQRGLTQKQLGSIVGITQGHVSDFLNGKLVGVSEFKLMHCLTRLGYDVEIRIRRASDDKGKLVLR